jgi:voltage-gated potassium channel
MINNHYTKGLRWIEKHRFQLLLAATILVLILPAMAVNEILRLILFSASMSFLLIQSIIVATTKKTKKPGFRYSIVTIIIIIIWLEPLGIKIPIFDDFKLLIIVVFFVFVTFHLVKFLRRSSKVDVNVIITAINIYLLMGIISGSLAFLFYKTFPDAYNFPSYIPEPNFVNFNYYSFVTMSTVGYGDITPRLPQTQTLAYLIAVTGQLYVAIIMAFLVGKLLMHGQKDGK